MRDDVKEWLLLSAIEGVGATRLKLLIEYFGSPKAVLDASFQQLIAVSKIDEKIAKNITHQRAFKFAEKQIEIAEKYKVEIIPFIDERYPKNLLKIYDPPAFLYIRGKIKKEDDIASDLERDNFMSADEAMKYMTEVGRRYENMMTTLDGETLLTKIYSETLRSIITSGVWRKIFESISEVTTLIKEEKSE